MRLFKIILFLLISFLTMKCNGGDKLNKYLKKVYYQDSLCYISLKPEKIKGVVILFHGYGGDPESVIKSSQFPLKLLKNDFLVFIPSFYDTSFYLDESTQVIIEDFMEFILGKYDLQNLPLFLCGFSLGGSGAIKYVQGMKEKEIPNNIKGVIAIDPPLDLNRMYSSYKKTLSRNANSITKNEAQYVLNILNSKYQFNANDLTQLWRYSVYSFNDTIYEEDKYIDIPVLLYSEPAIEWQIENRNRDLYDLNVLDGSAFVNFLIANGNNNARLEITHDKGFRNNKLHPHSWSILNEDFTVDWIKKLSKLK